MWPLGLMLQARTGRIRLHPHFYLGRQKGHRHHDEPSKAWRELQWNDLQRELEGWKRPQLEHRQPRRRGNSQELGPLRTLVEAVGAGVVAAGMQQRQQQPGTGLRQRWCRCNPCCSQRYSCSLDRRLDFRRGHKQQLTPWPHGPWQHLHWAHS